MVISPSRAAALLAARRASLAAEIAPVSAAAVGFPSVCTDPLVELNSRIAFATLSATCAVSAAIFEASVAEAAGARV